MIHANSGVDCDLSVISFENNYQELLDKTDERAIGIILTLEGSRYIGEIIGSNPDVYNGLRVHIVDHLPTDMWILYNKIDAIYSNGI